MQATPPLSALTSHNSSPSSPHRSQTPNASQMSQHQNPHRPQHSATLTIDLSMTKLGYLERWLIPHGRPVDDTDVTLTEDDPQQCMIYMSAFPSPAHENDTDVLSTHSPDTCSPVRLQPCGHVIGAPCLKAWLSASRWKAPVCLQCTQVLDLMPKSTARTVAKKLPGNVVVRTVELIIKLTGVLVLVLVVGVCGLLIMAAVGVITLWKRC